MKYPTFVFSLLFLLGCNPIDEDDSNTTNQETANVSIHDINLSGTWKSVTETKTIRSDTKDYLSSDFREETLILEETDQGIKINDCFNYGDIYSSYGVKSGNKFYTSSYDASRPGFTPISHKVLQQHRTFEDKYVPGIIFEEIITLTKISDSPQIDSGSLSISGPFMLNEESHICLFRSYSNVGTYRSYTINTPLDDGTLSFTIRLIGDITPSTYEYDDIYPDPQVRLDIYSSTDAFLNAVQSYSLGEHYTSISINEYSEDVLEGSFSLLSESEESYTGQFYFQLR